MFETKEEEYGGALKTFVARYHAPGCGGGKGDTKGCIEMKTLA